MVIGFHYHLPVKITEQGKLYTQSFYGLFLDSLCAQCERLIVFSYTPTNSEEASINYELRSANIKVVNLGVHDSLPKRLLRFGQTRNLIANNLKEVDILLIRSPTPLVIVFKWIKKTKPVILYLVGDFLGTARGLPFWRIKTFLIKIVGHGIQWAQRSIAQNNTVISNSQSLLDQYSDIAKKTVLVRSTTLTSTDFVNRADTCNEAVIRVLYTGRIDPLKGLNESISACSRLAEKAYKIEFHFAGPLVKGLESLPLEIIKKFENSILKDKIFYHGLKKVGQELNSLYRSSDVYVIASTGMEGFPRTIWEAMANGLPVIASSIGSIPLFLKHKESAYLVPPGNVDGIERALLEIITNKDLRTIIRTNGQSIAKSNTLEVQSRKMIDVLRTHLFEI